MNEPTNTPTEDDRQRTELAKIELTSGATIILSCERWDGSHTPSLRVERRAVNRKLVSFAVSFRHRHTFLAAVQRWADQCAAQQDENTPSTNDGAPPRRRVLDVRGQGAGQQRNGGGR